MRQNTDTPALLQLHDLRIDYGQHSVSRSGKELKLPGLSKRMLLALVEAAPNVLTADDLIEQVWGGRVVSPETITQRVKLLRRSLGDDAQNPTYVGLVRGGGYRLLLMPEVLEPTATAHHEQPASGGSLAAELNRRRVPQTALIYAAVAWTFTEALAFIMDAIPIFPSWSHIAIAVLFITGFPVAMFLAWRFDLSPDGIQRTESQRRRSRLTIAAAIGLMLLATAGLSYLLTTALDRQPAVTEGTVVPLAPIDVVALLPFTFDVQDGTFLSLGAGLNDELRDHLRDFGIKMVARTSSRAFVNDALMATEISQRLGAGTLIEGEIRRLENQIRISVAVVDGLTGTERWSDNFVGDEDNLLDLQNVVAKSIAAQLVPTVATNEVATTTRGRQAHNLLLLGRHFEQQVRDKRVVDQEGLERAISLYRRAATIDAESAIAHSRLAGALLYRGDVEGARIAIDKAVEIDHELADVQFNLGLFHWATGDNRAGAAYAKAVELDPNHAQALAAYAQWIWIAPDYIEPLQYFERALELDPMVLARYSDLGNFLGWRGDVSKGDVARTLNIAEQIETRFDSAEAYEIRAHLTSLAGKLDEGIAIAWQGHKQAKGAVADFTWQLSELYSRIGDHKTAKQLLPEPDVSQLFFERNYAALIDLAEELIIDRPEEKPIYYQLAFAYNTQGQFAAASRILTLAGLPEAAYSGARRSQDIEAMGTLSNALRAQGRLVEARTVAEWHGQMMTRVLTTGGGLAWWDLTYSACAAMNLGDEASALVHLEKIRESLPLPWIPTILDSQCFAPLQYNSTYLALQRHLSDRQQALRRGLPAVLRKHGLTEYVQVTLEKKRAIEN